MKNPIEIFGRLIEAFEILVAGFFAIGIALSGWGIPGVKKVFPKIAADWKGVFK